MEAKLYTTAEAAEYLGIGRRTLDKYIKLYEMPIAGFKKGNTRIFAIDELNRFADFMRSEEFEALTKPGRKPDDPQTKTVTLPDGTKKRVNLTYRGRKEEDGS